jgi:hypothetical protein
VLLVQEIGFKVCEADGLACAAGEDVVEGDGGQDGGQANGRTTEPHRSTRWWRGETRKQRWCREPWARMK